MAINMMCMKSNCKYYYEDCCTRNINEERIVINENGQCETFEEGESDWYTCPEEPRFLIEEDSICYGCPYFKDEDKECNPPDVCVEGSMNGYRMNG